jgi:serine/threonine-protein kinase HipA
LPKGHAVAVKRFDRTGASRLHVLSAHVALRAAGEPMGYPELAQLIRRLGHPDQVRAQQQELFRRMVFNILIDNTDDHEKNHALVRGEHGFYALSPAFDVLPSAQGLGYQQMRVGAMGHESSMANALSEARAFGLMDAQARQMATEISGQVAQWKAVFKSLNVRDADVSGWGAVGRTAPSSGWVNGLPRSGYSSRFDDWLSPPTPPQCPWRSSRAYPAAHSA